MGNEKSKVNEFKVPLLSPIQLKLFSAHDNLLESQSRNTLIATPFEKKEKEKEAKKVVDVAKEVESKQESKICAIQVFADAVPLILSTMKHVVRYYLLSFEGKLSIIYSHDNIAFHALEISIPSIIAGIFVEIGADNLLDLFNKLSHIVADKSPPSIQITIHMKLSNSQIIFSLEDVFLIYPVINHDSAEKIVTDKINMLNDKETKDNLLYICPTPSLINPMHSSPNSQCCICSLEKNTSSYNSLWIENKTTTMKFSVFKSTSIIFSADIDHRQYTKNAPAITAFQDMDSKMNASLVLCGEGKDYLKIKYYGQNIFNMMTLTSFYPNIVT